MNTDNNFPILNLPAELKRRTASFLSPQDALRLSESCKNLHSSLSLRLLRDSHTLFTRRTIDGAYYTGDREHPFAWIPRLSRRVHSISITFRWRDQGWGNRKGRVWIIGRPSDGRPAANDKRFHGGRIVCESPLAPHDVSAQKLSFLTLEGEIYQMWYRAGAGGGHQLMLLDGRLQTVIFDDQEGNISRNYGILRTFGAVARDEDSRNNTSNNNRNAPQSSFYSQLLLHSSRSLRAQIDRQRRENASQLLDDTMVSFFHSYGIEVTEASLLAVEEIVQADLDTQALAPVEPPVSDEEDDDDDEEEEDEDEEDDITDNDPFAPGLGGFHRLLRHDALGFHPPGMAVFRLAMGEMGMDFNGPFFGGPPGRPMHDDVQERQNRHNDMQERFNRARLFVDGLNLEQPRHNNNNQGNNDRGGEESESDDSSRTIPPWEVRRSDSGDDDDSSHASVPLLYRPPRSRSSDGSSHPSMPALVPRPEIWDSDSDDDEPPPLYIRYQRHEDQENIPELD